MDEILIHVSSEIVQFSEKPHTILFKSFFNAVLVDLTR